MYDQASTLRNLMSEINLERHKESSFNRGIQRKTRIVLFTGGKGGIGKTLLTANVGSVISHKSTRVLLLGADFGLANLDVVMNLPAEYSIEDVFSQKKDVMDVICKKAENLYLLPASSGFIGVNELSQANKYILMDQFENLPIHFDMIFIDCPAGVSKNVQQWAKFATEVLLITTPEPTSMADAYATMKILRHTSMVDRFKLVVNMTSSEEEAIRVFDRLSTVAFDHLSVKVTYMGFLASEQLIKQSIRERSVLVEKYPFSESAKQFRSLGNSLLSDTEEEDQGNVTTQNVFWKQWISRNQNEVNFN